MFEGYWGRPEATVETSRNWWYHTGDIGRIDDDGFLFFVDRKADYLRRRGENISSFEVERILMGHGALADVAVHAVPSELTEDDLKITATLQAEGRRSREEELFRWCIDELPVLRPAPLHRVPRRAAPQPGRPGAEANPARRRGHRRHVVSRRRRDRDREALTCRSGAPTHELRRDKGPSAVFAAPKAGTLTSCLPWTIVMWTPSSSTWTAW